MRYLGLLNLFRFQPQSAVGAGGQMALGDHLREFRARLMRSLLVIIVGIIIAFAFWHQLLSLVSDPYQQAKQALGGSVDTTIYVSGVTAPLMIQLKLCSLAGVIGTSPYWLYQLWAFIMPGLHRNERKWTIVFVSVAGPLFVAGVSIGYYILPKGIQVLISFTPSAMQNLVEFNEFFSFMTGMLLIFGIAFEIPLFVILLNLAGILRGAVLAKYRPFIIVGIFIFAAVGTPSTDPFSMLALAIPMVILYEASEVIARLLDRRKKAARLAASPWADDEPSAIGEEAEEFTASDLDDEGDASS